MKCLSENALLATGLFNIKFAGVENVSAVGAFAKKRVSTNLQSE